MLLVSRLPDNENKIPVGIRITGYAFSRATPRKSGLLSEQQKSGIKEIASVLPSRQKMWLAPGMPESLRDRYTELLSGSYDCTDRIVLNAYFRMGHTPGGFRVWWGTLTGSEETLDNAHLMRMAGRFSRRLHGYAKAEGIPLVHCQAGEHKHELAEEYLTKTQITEGLFLILVGRAQAPVWHISAKHHIEPKRPMPYVNHYSFHILDPEWGHLTIKISGHPPFPAQVILNRHEYVACAQGWHHLHQGGKLLYYDLRRRRSGQDRRHLVRAPGYRATEPGLRALDLRLCMLRARLRRAEAQRVPLPVLQLSDRIQSKPGLPGGRAHGPGVSGPH